MVWWSDSLVVFCSGSLVVWWSCGLVVWWSGLSGVSPWTTGSGGRGATCLSARRLDQQVSFKRFIFSENIQSVTLCANCFDCISSNISIISYTMDTILGIGSGITSVVLCTPSVLARK